LHDAVCSQLYVLVRDWRWHLSKLGHRQLDDGFKNHTDRMGVRLCNHVAFQT